MTLPQSSKTFLEDFSPVVPGARIQWAQGLVCEGCLTVPPAVRRMRGGGTEEREPGEDNRKRTEGGHAGGAVPRRQERGRPMERRSFEVMKILHGGLESNRSPPPVIWSRPEFPGLEPYEHSLTHAHF